MNNISIVGRIVRDFELQQTQSQIPICRFTVAVPNESKNSDGERQADFFLCVAWRETAETIAKYFKKGYPIGVIGSMNSRQYKAKDGGTSTIWELNVKNFSFVGGTFEEKSKKGNSTEEEEMTPLDNDEELPF